MNIPDGFRSRQRVSGNGAPDPLTHQSTNAIMAATQGKEGFRADEADASSAVSSAAQAAADPHVRMEKVAAVRQALAAGTYKVSNYDIAASLVNYMLQW